MEWRRIWMLLADLLRRQQPQPDPTAELRELTDAEDPVSLPPEPETQPPPDLPPELLEEDAADEQGEADIPSVAHVGGPLAEAEPPELPEPSALPDLDAELPVEIEPFEGMVSDDDRPEGDPTLKDVADATDFSKIAADLFEDEHQRGAFPEPLEAEPDTPMEVQEAEADPALAARVEAVERALPDPYEPELLSEDYVKTFYRVVTNEGSGEYTVRKQEWETTTPGLQDVTDTTDPDYNTDLTAYHHLGVSTLVVNEKVPGWTVEVSGESVLLVGSPDVAIPDIPDGTAENQMLRWNHTTKVWVTVAAPDADYKVLQRKSDDSLGFDWVRAH